MPAILFSPCRSLLRRFLRGDGCLICSTSSNVWPPEGSALVTSSFVTRGGGRGGGGQHRPNAMESILITDKCFRMKSYHMFPPGWTVQPKMNQIMFWLMQIFGLMQHQWFLFKVAKHVFIVLFEMFLPIWCVFPQSCIPQSMVKPSWSMTSHSRCKVIRDWMDPTSKIIILKNKFWLRQVMMLGTWQSSKYIQQIQNNSTC